MLAAFLQALLFQAGYNAALVALGASLLGIAAGSSGAFLFLRKRALVSDAIAHATLPGVGLAYIFMVMLGGDGRSLPGLLLGSALSAGAGLLAVQWIVARTRLAEDAAIGAVLSVFFGFGIVLLTVIQNMSRGYQAGLEGFLLGSTAGMLFQDALLIAAGGALAIGLVFLFRRPMTITAFDPEFAAAVSINIRHMDLAMMGLVMGVTVIGLKLVGLILIVAMLIIPPVTARLWTERTDHVVLIAGLFGGLSGYLGAALSASAPSLPTGPIIVLIAFGLFTVSLLAAPRRGLLAGVLLRQRYRISLHRHQGLLAIARNEPIRNRTTLKVLRRERLIGRDEKATGKGRALAAKAVRDEERWALAQQLYTDDALAGGYDGSKPIEELLTRDEIVDIDQRLSGPSRQP